MAFEWFLHGNMARESKSPSLGTCLTHGAALYVPSIYSISQQFKCKHYHAPWLFFFPHSSSSMADTIEAVLNLLIMEAVPTCCKHRHAKACPQILLEMGSLPLLNTEQSHSLHLSRRLDSHFIRNHMSFPSLYHYYLDYGNL